MRKKRVNLFGFFDIIFFSLLDGIIVFIYIPEYNKKLPFWAESVYSH
jgi:hypothetical protein